MYDVHSIHFRIETYSLVTFKCLIKFTAFKNRWNIRYTSHLECTKIIFFEIKYLHIYIFTIIKLKVLFELAYNWEVAMHFYHYNSKNIFCTFQIKYIFYISLILEWNEMKVDIYMVQCIFSNTTSTPDFGCTMYTTSILKWRRLSHLK